MWTSPSPPTTTKFSINPHHHKTCLKIMGIQRKPQRSLQELLESQPGRGEAAKPSQPKLLPLPPKSPPRAFQPPPPSRIEQVDPKRRREPKGKEAMKPGRSRPSNEEEAHRLSKQQRTSHAPSRGSERGDVQLPEPQAWLPAPMLGGEPLMDDASIRDFNGGIGCHVASVLEETLLLSRDMVELRGFKMSEVFLHTKRLLGMVCIYFFTVFFYILDTILILFLFFFLKGCSKHFQVRGDVQLSLSTTGRREETGGCCCANPDYC